MVGEEFKKFGAVKPDGIQVRNSKVSNSWFWFQVSSFDIFSDTLTLLLQYDELCFGFVEFESQQSMQAAIEVRLFFSYLHMSSI